MKKLIFLSVFFLMLLLPFSANAEENEFSAELNKTELISGENIRLSISYNGNKDIRGFFIKVSYDETQLKYLYADMKTSGIANSDDGNGNGYFACAVDSPMSGALFDVVYKTNSLTDGKLDLDVNVSEVCGAGGVQIVEDENFTLNAEMLPPPSNEALLLSLSPSSGTLEPEFSPDISEYTMSVPYSVSSVSFTGSASDGAEFSVNRKNLGSGGSTTRFTVKVTAADGEHKNLYYINVTRGEYQQISSTDEGGNDEKPLLLSLSPSSGALNEEFAPQINSYTMSVDYSVRSLSFFAEPESGADISVNRKNLGSGGSTTDFIITLKKGSAKNIYTVSVTRGEYQGAGGENSIDAEAPLLLSLEPSVGSLNESFNPEVMNYSMDLPYSEKTLSFYTEAEDGAAVTINRKNLGPGGSTVDFKITVKRGDSKNIYTVSVTRGEYVRPSGSGTSGKNEHQVEVPEDGFNEETIIGEAGSYEADSALTVVSGGSGVSELLLFGFIVIASGTFLLLMFGHFKGENKDGKHRKDKDQE